MNFNQREVKVVLLGDSGTNSIVDVSIGVGKSSILLRFCQNEFKEGNEPTLGAAFQSKIMQIQEQQFKFQVASWRDGRSGTQLARKNINH
jgi:GTPase SAR1 family protein